MASNRNTQITPARNQLDPLGSFYQAKMRYQQIAGAVNGDNVDPHLQAYSLRLDDTPDVLWNLGGREVGDEVSFPRSAESQFDNFVRSTTKSTVNLLNQGNNYRNSGAQQPYEDYVYYDGASEAVITSLPNKLAESLLFSSMKIIEELEEGATNFGQTFPLGEINPQVYELNEIQEHFRNMPSNREGVRRFVDRLYMNLSEQARQRLYLRFIQDVEGQGPRRRIVDGTNQGFGVVGRVTENFLDVLHYFIRGEGTRTQGDQGQYSDDDESLVRQLYHFRITQALLPEIPTEILKGILTKPTMPRNTCIRYKSESAFVRDYFTYQEWDSDAFTNMAADSVRPVYNYYVPGYERLISGSVGEGIPEAALPNSYIRNLATRTNVYPNPGGWKTQATLDSLISESSLGAPGFYADYTRALPTAKQDEVEAAANLASLILVPASNGGILEQDLGVTAPMSIQVSFRRSPWDTTLQSINSQGTSLPILRILAEGYGSEGDDKLVYFSEFISTENGVQGMVPVTENFLTFDARDVFRRPFQGALTNTPFVVLSTSPINVKQRFENGVSLPQTLRDNEKCLAASQVMEAKAARNADRAYNRILNGEAMPSVALAYGLTKKTKRDNEIIQTVMFGNGFGSLNTTYNDTQVKYDTEYIYELDEFSLVYSPSYSVGVVCQNYPIWLMDQYLNIGRDGYLGKWTGDTLTSEERRPELLFEMYAKEYPAPKIVRLPVHDTKDMGDEFDFDQGGYESGLLGTAYSPVRILDRPPSPPMLEMLPLQGVDSQINVHVNTRAGSFTGNNALEAVSIGGQEDVFRSLYQYQRNNLNFTLPEGYLEFKPEGKSDIRNIVLYRTTQIDLNVDTYNELYKSFEETQPTVSVRRYTTSPSDILEENAGITPVLSYDLTDNIAPNTNYYYTCTVEDRHGNVSNPSTIFRVRIISDKGLMIPEIDTVIPKRIRPQVPTKNLTRYLQIDASNIQSFPYFELGPDNSIISAPNIASHLGNSIEDKAFIIRLTSKDTGRIFDIKLGFEVKYGDEDESPAEAEQQGAGRPGGQEAPPAEEQESEEEDLPPVGAHDNWEDMQDRHNAQQEEEEEENEEVLYSDIAGLDDL